MIPYQFENAVTVDLENMVAVDEISHINASINAHSDWYYGEYFYDMVFKFSSNKVRRYNSDKELLHSERNQLIEDWKAGRSRCLVENN